MITKFDKEIQAIEPKLTMFPWIGDKYDSTRVLFIGESDYNDGVEFHQGWKRDWISIQRIEGTKGDSKLLNNIDRTILGNKMNAVSQKNLWESVAYTNLVQRIMNKHNGKFEAPNKQDLFEGWQTMLHLCLILKPQVVVKWGIAGDGVLRGNVHKKVITGWNIEMLNNNSRFLFLEHETGYKVKILIVDHPSKRGFNSTKLGEYIQSNLPELVALNLV